MVRFVLVSRIEVDKIFSLFVGNLVGFVDLSVEVAV